ncbi:nuclear transport factor 2-like protein [Saccharopolyspora pogona]|uniref:hypothetical protein n=1 Tax=Saccharopolyspora pogona TaxID=333966 RepID=UPI001CC26086|nr:hypothetical protein [Saccharopolyspora pogona]
MSSSEVQAKKHDPQGLREFAVPCVFVLRVRDGQIVESRDYVDHFAFAGPAARSTRSSRAETPPRGSARTKLRARDAYDDFRPVRRR